MKCPLRQSCPGARMSGNANVLDIHRMHFAMAQLPGRAAHMLQQCVTGSGSTCWRWGLRSVGVGKIAPISLDRPTGLKTMGHIFVSEKPDFYEIVDDVPQYDGSSNGELVNDYK